MTDISIDPAVRADVEHLLELWDMLPSWSETEFWKSLNQAESGDPDNEYFPGKVHSVRHLAEEFLKRGGDRTDRSLQYIAQYVLMFFDRDDDLMYGVLDRVGSFDPPYKGFTGRRWADDATATAWRLYVPSQAQIMRDGRDGTGNTPPWMES